MADNISRTSAEIASSLQSGVSEWDASLSSFSDSANAAGARYATFSEGIIADTQAVVGALTELKGATAGLSDISALPASHGRAITSDIGASIANEMAAANAAAEAQAVQKIQSEKRFTPYSPEWYAAQQANANKENIGWQNPNPTPADLANQFYGPRTAQEEAQLKQLNARRLDQELMAYQQEAARAADQAARDALDAEARIARQEAFSQGWNIFQSDAQAIQSKFGNDPKKMRSAMADLFNIGQGSVSGTGQFTSPYSGGVLDATSMPGYTSAIRASQSRLQEIEQNILPKFMETPFQALEKGLTSATLRLRNIAERYMVAPGRNLMQLSGRMMFMGTLPVLGMIGGGLMYGSHLQQLAAHAATQFANPIPGVSTNLMMQMALRMGRTIPISPSDIVTGAYSFESAFSRDPVTGNRYNYNQLYGGKNSPYAQLLKYSYGQQIQPMLATQAVGKLMAAFKIPLPQMSRVLNALAYTATQSQILPQDIATNIGRISGVAYQHGVSLPQALGMMTFLTRFMPARQATTGLETLMMNLGSKASNWAAVAKLASTAGYANASSLMPIDSQGARSLPQLMQGLGGLLDWIKSHYSKPQAAAATQAIIHALLPNIRGTQAGLFLSQGGPVLSGIIGGISGAYNQNNPALMTYLQHYNQQLDTLHSKWQLVKNDLGSFVTSMSMLPVVSVGITLIGDAFKKISDAFSSMPPQQKTEWLFKLLAIAAAPIATWGIGALVESIGLLITYVTTLASPIGLVGLALFGRQIGNIISDFSKMSSIGGGGITGIVKGLAVLGVQMGWWDKKQGFNILSKILGDKKFTKKDFEELANSHSKMSKTTGDLANQFKAIGDFAKSAYSAISKVFSMLMAARGSIPSIAGIIGLAYATEKLKEFKNNLSGIIGRYGSSNKQTSLGTGTIGGSIVSGSEAGSKLYYEAIVQASGKAAGKIAVGEEAGASVAGTKIASDEEAAAVVIGRKITAGMDAGLLGNLANVKYSKSGALILPEGITRDEQLKLESESRQSWFKKLFANTKEAGHGIMGFGSDMMLTMALMQGVQAGFTSFHAPNKKHNDALGWLNSILGVSGAVAVATAPWLLAQSGLKVGEKILGSSSLWGGLSKLAGKSEFGTKAWVTADDLFPKALSFIPKLAGIGGRAAGIAGLVATAIATEFRNLGIISGKTPVLGGLSLQSLPLIGGAFKLSRTDAFMSLFPGGAEIVGIKLIASAVHKFLSSTAIGQAISHSGIAKDVGAALHNAVNNLDKSGVWSGVKHAVSGVGAAFYNGIHSGLIKAIGATGYNFGHSGFVRGLSKAVHAAVSFAIINPFMSAKDFLGGPLGATGHFMGGIFGGIGSHAGNALGWAGSGIGSWFGSGSKKDGKHVIRAINDNYIATVRNIGEDLGKNIGKGISRKFSDTLDSVKHVNKDKLHEVLTDTQKFTKDNLNAFSWLSNKLVDQSVWPDMFKKIISVAEDSFKKIKGNQKDGLNSIETDFTNFSVKFDSNNQQFFSNWTSKQGDGIKKLLSDFSGFSNQYVDKTKSLFSNIQNRTQDFWNVIRARFKTGQNNIESDQRRFDNIFTSNFTNTYDKNITSTDHFVTKTESKIKGMISWAKTHPIIFTTKYQQQGMMGGGTGAGGMLNNWVKTAGLKQAFIDGMFGPNSFGAQCVNLVNNWLKRFGAPETAGNAAAFTSNPLYRSGTQGLVPGDPLVWIPNNPNSNAQTGPEGHVDIFDKWGNGGFWTWDQNWASGGTGSPPRLVFHSGNPSQYAEGYLNMSNYFPKTSNFQGAGGVNWGVVPGGVSRWRGIIMNAAKKFHIPAALIAAVMNMESGGQPGAVSPAGAQGLMQIMPFNDAGLGISNPFDPTQSIMGGAKMLSQDFRQFGNWVTALAAYNAGPGNLSAGMSYGNSVNATFQQYSGGQGGAGGGGNQWTIPTGWWDSISTLAKSLGKAKKTKGFGGAALKHMLILLNPYIQSIEAQYGNNHQMVRQGIEQLKANVAAGRPPWGWLRSGSDWANQCKRAGDYILQTWLRWHTTSSYKNKDSHRGWDLANNAVNKILQSNMSDAQMGYALSALEEQARVDYSTGQKFEGQYITSPAELAGVEQRISSGKLVLRNPQHKIQEKSRQAQKAEHDHKIWLGRVKHKYNNDPTYMITVIQDKEFWVRQQRVLGRMNSTYLSEWSVLLAKDLKHFRKLKSSKITNAGWVQEAPGIYVWNPFDDPGLMSPTGNPIPATAPTSNPNAPYGVGQVKPHHKKVVKHPPFNTSSHIMNEWQHHLVQMCRHGRLADSVLYKLWNNESQAYAWWQSKHHAGKDSTIHTNSVGAAGNIFTGVDIGAMAKGAPVLNSKNNNLIEKNNINVINRTLATLASEMIKSREHQTKMHGKSVVKVQIGPQKIELDGQKVGEILSKEFQKEYNVLMGEGVGGW